MKIIRTIIISLLLMDLIAFDGVLAEKINTFELTRWDAIRIFGLSLLSVPKRSDKAIQIRTNIFTDKNQLLNALSLIKISREDKTSMLDLTKLEDKIVEAAALQSPENEKLIRESFDKGYRQGYHDAKLRYYLGVSYW